MKRHLLLLLFVVLSISSYAATTTTSGDRMLSWYSINITMVNQEPDPAEAGRYVTVRFKIENSGRENAEDVTLELLPEYPFSLDPGKSPIKYIGSVHGRQLGDIGVIVDYKLRIDENAIEGDNEIELRYKIADGHWIKPEPFYINIQPHDILLSIDSIETPEKLKPGNSGDIKINLKNLAFSYIKDIRVKLGLDNLPISTVGMSNEKIIKQLEPNTVGSVEFTIMADPDAESNVYKLPINIEFFDKLGTKYNKNGTVGLIIGAEPDLSVYIDSTDIYRPDSSGEISIKFVNKGVTDIKFLNVILKETDEYNVIGSNQAYIGNIESDDYETTDFKLSVKKTKSKELTIPLLIDYRDASNREYKKELNLKLRLYSASEAKKLGLVKGRSSVGILIIVIIVVVGVFIYLRRKKKGKGFRIPFFKKK